MHKSILQVLVCFAVFVGISYQNNDDLEVKNAMKRAFDEGLQRFEGDQQAQPRNKDKFHPNDVDSYSTNAQTTKLFKPLTHLSQYNQQSKNILVDVEQANSECKRHLNQCEATLAGFQSSRPMNSTMPSKQELDTMKIAARDIAYEAQKKFTKYAVMALYISDKFEKLFGSSWQCIVGNIGAFGACAADDSAYYIDFKLGPMRVILYKVGFSKNKWNV